MARIEARLPLVEAFDLQALGRGPGAAWRDDWPQHDVAPDAVSFSVTRSAGASDTPDAPESLRNVVRRGLERAP